MPKLNTNGLELEYESIGDPAGEPVVLVMGVGAQLIHWPDGFCEQLAERGFRVIRFDNRDIGLSTKLDHLGVPGIKWMAAKAMLGLKVQGPYLLRDMADDTAGLIEALGYESAHVVGISMGGMVSQELAIWHPGRVRTLTSLMSSTGGRHRPKLKAVRALLGRAPRNKDEAARDSANLMRVISGPGFPFREERYRALGARGYERSHYPRGFVRQMAAILASGSRRWALPRIQCPTLVVHGDSDPLVPPAAGKATAAAIPGATLRIIEGLGHSLPEEVWPTLVEEISGLAARSSGVQQATK